MMTTSFSTTPKKCYKPVAMGPGGIAVCILDDGHEGRCDGGAMERRIGEAFAAQMAASEFDHDDQDWKSWG